MKERQNVSVFFFTFLARLQMLYMFREDFPRPFRTDVVDTTKNEKELECEDERKVFLPWGFSLYYKVEWGRELHKCTNGPVFFISRDRERERELFIRKKKERTSRERERGAALVRANKAWRLIFFFVFLLPFWFLDCALPPCWLGKTEDGQIRRSHCEFKIPPLSLSPLTPHPVKEGSCFCFDLSPG